MAARKITRRPWNLRPGDVLSDGRIVARVTMVPGRFMVIMRNGAALSGDASAPSVTVTRESAAPSSSTVWRSVRGADLVVGMRVRFSNVVHTVVDMVDVPAYVDPGTGWTIRDAYAVVVTRHAWHVDEACGGAKVRR